MKPYQPSPSLERTILDKLFGRSNPFLSIWVALFASIAMTIMSFVPHIRETMNHVIMAQIIFTIISVGWISFLVKRKQEYSRVKIFLLELLSEIRCAEGLILNMKGKSSQITYWGPRKSLIFAELTLWEYGLIKSLLVTYEKETGKEIKIYTHRHDLTVNGKLEFYWFAMNKFKNAMSLKDIRNICLQ